MSMCFLIFRTNMQILKMVVYGIEKLGSYQYDFLITHILNIHHLCLFLRKKHLPFSSFFEKKLFYFFICLQTVFEDNQISRRHSSDGESTKNCIDIGNTAEFF